jgi:hypothetical protein
VAQEMKMIDSWGVFGDGLDQQNESEDDADEKPTLDWDNV